MIGNDPVVILPAFRFVKAEPFPEKLVAFNVAKSGSKVKLVSCWNVDAPPKNNSKLLIVDNPVPPFAIGIALVIDKVFATLSQEIFVVCAEFNIL